jgi:hypothetical protein
MAGPGWRDQRRMRIVAAQLPYANVAAKRIAAIT